MQVPLQMPSHSMIGWRLSWSSILVQRDIGPSSALICDCYQCLQKSALLEAYTQHAGQLTRAAVELAKLWRSDKYLRKLDVS